MKWRFTKTFQDHTQSTIIKDCKRPKATKLYKTLLAELDNDTITRFTYEHEKTI